MSQSNSAISAKIPTNIITGFLGVGKTTAITHLLKHKPEGEKWSVLVNEFGEIGIDGAMLQSPGVAVREVPGGCICCVAGLPMKMALNMLIQRTRPDRLLVEPTGLGHPAEIINTLSGEYYDQVLDLRATITLVDPRKLSDERYTGNETFHNQLAVADVLVANKADLCGEADHQAFAQLVQSFTPAKQLTPWVEQGAIDLAWLDLPRQTTFSGQTATSAQPQSNRLRPPSQGYNTQVMLPEGEDFVRRASRGEGHFACGWLFRPELQFDFNQLFGWLMAVPVVRTKAVMHTDQGVFSFNAEHGVLRVNPLPVEPADLSDSRIEFIDTEPLPEDELEQHLLAAKREQ